MQVRMQMQMQVHGGCRGPGDVFGGRPLPGVALDGDGGGGAQRPRDDVTAAV